MARPLRIEYAGAMYHVMARGNARQIILLEDKDREKMLKDLEDSVVRYGWEMFSFCLMPNHFHLFFLHPSRICQGECSDCCRLMPMASPKGTGGPVIYSKADSKASWWKMKRIFGRSAATSI